MEFPIDSLLFQEVDYDRPSLNPLSFFRENVLLSCSLPMKSLLQWHVQMSTIGHSNILSQKQLTCCIQRAKLYVEVQDYNELTW